MKFYGYWLLLLIFVKSSYCYSQNTGTFTDRRDNHIYKWIKLGDQIWMGQNLAFKADEGCWAYDDDHKNVDVYGYLYDWNAAMTSCPDGWHLPADQEWEKLAVYVSQNYDGCEKKDENWINVGDFLKSDKGWNFDGNGNNLTGMSFVPGGWRSYVGDFKAIEESCSFWSSTLNNETSAWKRGVVYKDTEFKRSYSLGATGFSVRCIKN